MAKKEAEKEEAQEEPEDSKEEVEETKAEDVEEKSDEESSKEESEEKESKEESEKEASDEESFEEEVSEAEKAEAESSKEDSEPERIDPEEPTVSKSVSSITFSVFSPKMVKQMSSAKIVTPELYDKEGYPVDGGLMDIRLGVIDPGLKCKTCGSKLKECSGHFGYIELARPIMHIKFIPLLLNLLKCSCKSCGRVLIPKNKVDASKKELNQIEKDMGLEERRRSVKDIISSLKTVNKCPW